MNKDNDLRWDRLKKSRLKMFLALYIPVQIVTLMIGAILHLLIPTSMWCDADGHNMIAEKLTCGFEQFMFIFYLTLAISILSGLCGVLFPNKTANAMKG